MTPTTRDEREYDPVEEACELNDAAVESYRAGRVEEAEGLFRGALNLLLEAEGEDSPDVANILSGLGAVRERLCDYKGAEVFYARAAAVMDSNADSDDEDVLRLRLRTLANLGRITRILGRYEEAEPVIKRSLAAFERTLPEGHPNLTACRDNLAELRRQEGRPE